MESLLLCSYKFPRPMVTVDILLLRQQHDQRQVLLVRRARNPFRGRWALPGGYVEPDEPLETAAERELKEETDLDDLPLRQLGAFGDPGRDPRGHTITIVYGTIVSPDLRIRPRAGDDAGEVRWFAVEALPELAFDHSKIIGECLKRLMQDIN